jgi:hypothetical protein
MQTNSPGARYLFPRPLEVGGKNEADIRIRILVNKIQTFSPGVRYLFPRPLEVGGENEADIRIRILVNDSLRLLLVLQHIVDPIQGELLRLQGVSGLVF